MDIMSAYWRYHTPIGGYPTPLFPIKWNRQPVWTGEIRLPTRWTACGLYRPDHRGPAKSQGVSLHAHRLQRRADAGHNHS